MKPSRTLVAALVLLITAAASAPAQTVERSFPLAADGTVFVDAYKGTIEVTTWERDEVQVSARIVADENRDLVALTEVTFDAERNRLRIKSDYSRAKQSKSVLGVQWGSVSLPFVHYTIKMPRTARLNIDDYKSEIRVSDLRADLLIDTYRSPIQVRNVRGDINIDTYRESINLSNVVGQVKIDGYRPTIRVDGLKGAIQVDVYRGDIEVAFDAFEGDSRIESQRADVSVTLPRDTGFYLSADVNRRGDLDGDFDVERLRRRDDGTYRGEINGGGPRLALETQRGAYRLRAR